MPTNPLPELTTNTERLIPLMLIGILTFATLLALINYPKYSVSGEELLSNPTFSNGFTGWEKHGKSAAFSQRDDVTVLSQESAKHNSRLMQNIKGDELAGVYLVTTQLGSTNIVPGSEEWQNGALVLVRADANNKRTGSYEIAGIQGSQGVSQYQKFIDIPAPTANITLTARMLNATGELLVKSVSLKPATKQTHYSTLRIILIAAWVSTSLILLVLHLIRFGLTTPFIILCSIAMLAIIGTLMPKQFAIDLNSTIANQMPGQFNHGIRQTLNFFFPGYIGHTHQEISKLGHWLAFFSLTAASTVFLRKTPIYFFVISILLLAAATEALQFLTSARTPHIYDFLIDAAGVVVGLIVALPIRWLVQSRSS